MWAAKGVDGSRNCGCLSDILLTPLSPQLDVSSPWHLLNLSIGFSPIWGLLLAPQRLTWLPDSSSLGESTPWGKLWSNEKWGLVPGRNDFKGCPHGFLEDPPVGCTLVIYSSILPTNLDFIDLSPFPVSHPYMYFLGSPPSTQDPPWPRICFGGNPNKTKPILQISKNLGAKWIHYIYD